MKYWSQVGRRRDGSRRFKASSAAWRDLREEVEFRSLIFAREARVARPEVPE